MIIGIVVTQLFDSFTIFQSGQISGGQNMGIWCYQGQSDPPDIGFTEQIVVQRDVTLQKYLFSWWQSTNDHKKIWCKYLMYCFWTQFVYSFSLLRSWSI